MYTQSFFKQLLVVVCGLLLASCDKDYNEIGADLIDQNNSTIQTPYVLFKLYGKKDQSSGNIILPGTISGLSEDFAPEINSFRYVGSPFNLYRYGGVERSIKFDVKLYYFDLPSRISMKRTLDKLRMLVFPDENISAIKYKNNDNTRNSYRRFFNPLDSF